MTSTISAQIVGLGGLLGSSHSTQNAIRAQLRGVDPSTFSSGQSSTEAVVRRDPGAANATLTFMKSGQTMALPLELARTLIGQTYGSAQISIEITARDEHGTISATLSKILPSINSPSPSTLPLPKGFADISGSGKTLAEASYIPLATPKQWLNAITVLLSTPLAQPNAENSNLPQTSVVKTLANTQSGTEKSDPLLNKTNNTLDIAFSENGDIVRLIAARLTSALANLPAGAGIGYERTLAHASILGPEMATEVLSSIQKFPQNSSMDSAQNIQWTAQQANAAEHAEMMWHGQAWPGAPAWLAMGTRPMTSELGEEVFEKLGRSSPEFCSWIRMRVTPPGLGPIDLWAAILSSSRCHARLRANPEAKQNLELALGAFGSLLESARVDLLVDYRSEETTDE